VDLVSRSVPFTLDRAASDGVTLEGYAAVFNSWTEINDWSGQFLERVAPGAFAKTLGERMPVLQFDHGSHPLIGSLPLGSIQRVAEDEHGLFVRARLSDNWMVEPVRDAILAGGVSGMSFHFRVVKEDNETPTRASTYNPRRLQERTIREVALYEVGPVVFPAYEATSVGVRSIEIAQALTDPELRAEVARLLLGTSDDEPALPLVDEAAPDTEPREHSGLTPAQRAHILRLIERHRSNP
jgi:HK97 family phage prohead protease